MTEPAGISMKDLAERVKALEAEVKELREMIHASHRQNAETNRETQRAIGAVVSRSAKPPLRG